MRSGKLMRISFEADDHAAAEAEVAEMCRRLLANPVMETASWEIRSDEQIGEAAALPVTLVARRPRVTVAVFPGTWSERDFAHVATAVLGWEARLVWHTETDLGAPDAVVLPGGFAHGDHLRTGAIARFSPIMAAVEAFAAPAARSSAPATASRSSPRPDAAGGADAQRPPRVPLRLADAARRVAARRRRGSATSTTAS